MTADVAKTVLLARAGDSRSRLEAALEEAGASVVLAADPGDTDPDQVKALQPDVILVALEPAIEAALEAYQALFADTDIAVIFDDADLAAQREGWEAARWTRHLAAKLHGRDDVLPPGGESDDHLQPTPGPLPVNAARTDVNEALFAAEADALATEVPRDDHFLTGYNIPGFTADGTGGDAHDETTGPHDVAVAGEAASDDEVADFAVTWDDADDNTAVDTVAFTIDPEDDSTTQLDAEPQQDHFADLEEGVQESTLEEATEDGSASIFSNLSLVEDDPVPAASTPLSEPLSVAEEEEGAVVIEGGIGGPDAVRQLLAALPSGFPRPVLVRLQLDGGRYDRLVQQMGKASQMSVQLAEPGDCLAGCNVYFLAPGTGLLRTVDGLQFVESVDAASEIYRHLPTHDCALILLSGSDPSLVDAVIEHGAQGSLIAAQPAADCYEPTAAAALASRGGQAIPLAELAQTLNARWPSIVRDA